MLCISSQRGLGIVYLRWTGNAKAFIRGINDEFDTRASFFMLLYNTKLTCLSGIGKEKVYAYSMEKAKQKYLYFNSRHELYRINMQNIVYIEADGNYVHVVLRNQQRGMVCLSLMQMQAVLNYKLKEHAAVFARVGKRYIINLSYVYYINSLKQQLKLSDGQTFCHEISLSKDALRNLKELFVNNI